VRRDYPYARDAQGDRERQWQMEQDAQNTAWDRDLRGAEFGYGTNPSNAYLNAGQQQAQGANDAMGASAGFAHVLRPAPRPPWRTATGFAARSG
jgi:hypothetical protein